MKNLPVPLHARRKTVGELMLSVEPHRKSRVLPRLTDYPTTVLDETQHQARKIALLPLPPAS